MRLNTRTYFASGVDKQRIEKVNKVMQLHLNVPWLHLLFTSANVQTRLTLWPKPGMITKTYQ